VFPAIPLQLAIVGQWSTEANNHRKRGVGLGAWDEIRSHIFKISVLDNVLLRPE